jgi:hypothetical protein
LQSLALEHTNPPANIFSPFENGTAFHSISTQVIPSMNESILTKSILSKKPSHSLNTLDKVFYELTLSDGTDSSSHKSKPLEATNSLWFKDDLIGKIKDYKNGLLYQKEILKATNEELDRVISQVNLLLDIQGTSRINSRQACQLLCHQLSFVM